MYAMSDEELMSADLTEVVETPEQTAEETQQESPAVDEQEVSTEDTNTDTLDTSTEPSTETSEENTEEDTTDYKALYQRLTKFKANGKEVEITNPDDMITLMQQGANYNKKMAEIKPLRRVSKLLEDNGLLDEAELAYLIDLKNKNPNAIAKLVKESGIDVYEMNIDDADNYVPQVRTVSDVEIELQTTIDDLRANSPSFTTTIDIVGNQWDVESRNVLAENPELLRVLDSQVASGVFEQIDKYVRHERMLGRLQGYSDIQAYKAVGDMLFAQPQTQQVTQPIAQTPVTPTQPKPQNVDKKRAAAAPTNAGGVTNPPINYATMSDEEILKLVNGR